MKPLVTVLLVSFTLLLVDCTPKPKALPSHSDAPSTTTESQELQKPLRLEYKKMDETFVYFTLINETDIPYAHDINNDQVKIFENGQWSSFSQTKSTIYMAPVNIDPHSSTEIIRPKPDEVKYETGKFKLTIKLLNEDVGNEKLTSVFDL